MTAPDDIPRKETTRRFLYRFLPSVFLPVCTLVLFLFLAGAADSSQLAPSTRPAPPPQPYVDREASEEAFLESYDFFLNNRIWSAIDKLQEAQRHNVYFVDVYYLRSLALRRIGRYPEAIEAMVSYLEVRRTDPRAAIILDEMKLEWSVISRLLKSPSIESRYFFSARSFGEVFGLGRQTTPSFKGMSGLGKMSSSGGAVILCDTYGDRVWFFDRARRGAYTSIEAERPVVALAVAPGEALLFQKGGSVDRVSSKFMERTPSLEPLGSIAANVSDAEIIDSTLIAVADRTGSAVRFYGMPSLGETAEWSPNDRGERDKLFEPVALAAFGPYLAVADRGRGLVYVLEMPTISEVDRFEIESPRDIQWGNQGELYILSENGTLYSRYPVASNKGRVEVLASGLSDAWCMTWEHQGPLVVDVAGRTCWSSSIVPGQEESIGALTLYSPWIEERDGAETLMMRAIASSFFHGFIQDRIPDTQAVWRNEVRPSRVVEVNLENRGKIVFYSPSSGETTPDASIVPAVTLSDVMTDMAAVSRAGGEMPKVIVLDTRIATDDDSLELFFAYLLQQGVRLDLWAIGRPPSYLLSSISRITLGYTYYSRMLETVRFNSSYEWILSIPLPPDTFTFGYPSEATLSIFAAIDVIRFTDWMPVWPSLMKRTR